MTKLASNSKSTRGKKRQKPLDPEEFKEAVRMVQFGAAADDLALRFRFGPDMAQKTFEEAFGQVAGRRGEKLEQAEKRYIQGRSLLDRIEETTLIPLTREALLGLAEDMGMGVDFQFSALHEMASAWEIIMPTGSTFMRVNVGTDQVFIKDGIPIARTFFGEIPAYPDQKTRLKALELISKTTGILQSAAFSLVENAKEVSALELLQRSSEKAGSYAVVQFEKDPLPTE